jgi:hypothetical protein
MLAGTTVKHTRTLDHTRCRPCHIRFQVDLCEVDLCEVDLADSLHPYFIIIIIVMMMV